MQSFCSHLKNIFEMKDEDIIKKREECYCEEKASQVRIVYIIALVVWILIVACFSLYRTDVIGWIILSIPLVIFFTGYGNSNNLTIEVEKENFQANYFAIGLLLILPLLTWVNREYKGDKKRFTRILVLAIIIVMVSLLDVWVEKRYLSITKHAKSALQTIAIALLIYTLYTFYIDDPNSMFS